MHLKQQQLQQGQQQSEQGQLLKQGHEPRHEQPQGLEDKKGDYWGWEQFQLEQKMLDQKWVGTYILHGRSLWVQAHLASKHVVVQQALSKQEQAHITAMLQGEAAKGNQGSRSSTSGGDAGAVSSGGCSSAWSHGSSSSSSKQAGSAKHLSLLDLCACGLAHEPELFIPSGSIIHGITDSDMHVSAAGSDIHVDAVAGLGKWLPTLPGVLDATMGMGAWLYCCKHFCMRRRWVENICKHIKINTFHIFTCKS